MDKITTFITETTRFLSIHIKKTVAYIYMNLNFLRRA